jgi:hypothetical protein
MDKKGVITCQKVPVYTLSVPAPSPFVVTIDYNLAQLIANHSCGPDCSCWTKEWKDATVQDDTGLIA